MIEKICEVIDGKYCCDIDITTEEWKQLLINPKVFDDKSKEAIRKWYIEPGYSATCGYIGKKYNEHSMSANGIINGLAGRVQKELGRFVVKGIGDIATGTRFIVVMKSKQINTKPKTWEWTLREELIEAIEELSIFSDDSYSDDDLVSDISKSDITLDATDFKYTGKSKNKKVPVCIKNKYVYPRSRRVSINALRHAQHKCEFDNTHTTFLRKNSNLNYTEPHHLVPLTYYNKFEVSLDVEENIVSLCCNCHKNIHLGQGFEGMIEKLYNARKDLLKIVGIDISLDELIKLYKEDEC
ncbi:5-methylcytosine-specific restriction protein A [Clostridium saccharoperbutylacetonicum]|uniref:HNH endonuclease n=1 Tax=Clostridium saccharoperbutylacetonicum N1-4(HMT) TaxID=931276 RepID=M1LVN4_9CLOT|nr:HNH endonuclease [Clostridium saccharoperbutylacetonicum]AGF57215.1 HNH endonuclease [Clostridium saccharoperbutylacetonicum N1-4(HMT)]NRT62024.1 5-methylcytosine-specific restriction protein A [Clostridium saccharoperbutylacetonicum]NSB25353.1 5-methylcytosine-specific restriction protein A [Clostridium saccharoperbutylacetonicum]NSB44722.1 5-methylcytosine-specific restriction protein A [Clostridium saccharoperbutylacetonicum]